MEHAVTVITNMAAVNLHVLVWPTNFSGYNDTVWSFYQFTILFKKYSI